MNSISHATQIKPCTVSELAAIYGVSPRTMRKWIALHKQAIGEKHGHLFTALQVKVIFEKLGLPGFATD